MLEFRDRSFSVLIRLLLMLLKIRVNSPFVLKVYILFLCATYMQDRGDHVSPTSSYAMWPFVVIRSLLRLLPAVAPSIQVRVSQSFTPSFALNPHCFESPLPLFVPTKFKLSHSDHVLFQLSLDYFILLNRYIHVILL